MKRDGCPRFLRSNPWCNYRGKSQGDGTLAVAARRHERSTEEVREILRNAVKNEGAQRKPLGSRLRERFARTGLTDELPELRGEVARPGVSGP
jgi:plasmid stability protein